MLVTEEDVTLYIDDLVIETLPLEPPVGIFINGKTQVGKYVRKETTVPVSFKWLLAADELQLGSKHDCTNRHPVIGIL